MSRVRLLSGRQKSCEILCVVVALISSMLHTAYIYADCLVLWAYEYVRCYAYVLCDPLVCLAVLLDSRYAFA